MSDINQRLAVWQRPDRAGLFATIAWFVGAAIFLNAIIFSFGVDRNAGALDRISWAPPGRAVGAIWVMLFSLYAVSHWLLVQRGESGQRAARWVLAIAAWDLAYPLLTNGFDLQRGAWVNLVTAFFTILLLWRVWRDFANCVRLAAAIVGMGLLRNRADVRRAAGGEVVCCQMKKLYDPGSVACKSVPVLASCNRYRYGRRFPRRDSPSRAWWSQGDPHVRKR